jgi:hypothetical protein
MINRPHARAPARPHRRGCVGGSRVLFAAHWLVPLAFQLPLVLALVFSGHGWFSLATFVIPLSATRVPYRCTVNPTEMTIHWACFSETIAVDSIEAADLGPDPRRWVLGRREPVLTLTRRGAQRILIFGELYRLEWLRARLARAGIPDSARDGSA